MDQDKSESKIMLENICRHNSVIAKKEDSSTRGILKIKNSEDPVDNFVSILTKSAASGANISLAKGPKDDLLLWVFLKSHKNSKKTIISITELTIAFGPELILTLWKVESNFQMGQMLLWESKESSRNVEEVQNSAKDLAA